MDPDLYYQIKTIIRYLVTYLFRNNHETQFYSEMSQDILLEELPAHLRSQLITLIYKENNLDIIKFFQGKSPDFLNQILPLLKRITLSQDEVIYQYGDWADESTLVNIIIYLVYFILKGDVNLISSDDYMFRTYNQGSYFGEADILTNIVIIYNIYIYIYIYIYICVCVI